MNWKDLTIGQTLQVQEALDRYQKTNDELMLGVELLAALRGGKVEDYLNQPLSSVSVDIKQVLTDIDFVKTPLRPEDCTLELRVVIDGVTYEAETRPDNITAQQYEDYKAIVRDEPSNIAALCSVFYVPKGHKYNDGYDVRDVEKVFYEKLPITTAMALGFFFALLSETLRRGILSSSLRRLRRALRFRRLTTTQRKATLRAMAALRQRLAECIPTTSVFKALQKKHI